MGVRPDAIAGTLDAVADLAPDGGDRARRMWAHVRESHAARAV